MFAKNTVGMNAFFMISKKLTAELGLEAAMFLAILADAESIFEDEDWVFQTQPTVEAMSHGFLTRRKQEVGIKALIDAGIIEQQNRGLPMRRYFRIDNKRLIEFLA